MSLAVVIIASEKRRDTTFRRCLESVLLYPPDEIVVVADFPVEANHVRSLVVPPMTRTTVDALVKRDVGWMATLSDAICYLCDDHALDDWFMDSWQSCKYNQGEDWDILVPSRYCMRNGNFEWLPTGEDYNYVGGHAGIYKRRCGYLQPWAASHHHPNWDVLHSLQLRQKGCRVEYAQNFHLAVEDIEPDVEPWTMTPQQRAITDAFHRSLEGKVV